MILNPPLGKGEPHNKSKFIQLLNWKRCIWWGKKSNTQGNWLVTRGENHVHGWFRRIWQIKFRKWSWNMQTFSKLNQHKDTRTRIHKSNILFLFVCNRIILILSRSTSSLKMLISTILCQSCALEVSYLIRSWMRRTSMNSKQVKSWNKSCKR